jgi:hypothetical protein
MCDICHAIRCLPACPAYEGDLAGSGTAVGCCALCEGVIHEGERALTHGKRLLCLSCAEESDLEGLLYLEGAECLSDLLCNRLGLESRYV